MVAHPLVPAKVTDDIPRDFGDVISEAVLEFAKIRNWGPEHYDLWYHDAPVWYVREDRRTGDETWVTRAQIAPFRTPAGLELYAMPDVFIYDWAQKRVTAECSPEDRQRRSRVALLEPLLRTATDDRATAIKEILGLIAGAWTEAEALQPQPIQGSGVP